MTKPSIFPILNSLLDAGPIEQVGSHPSSFPSFTDKIAAKIEVSAGSERFDDPSENNSDQQLRVAFDWQVTEKVNLESKLLGRSVDYYPQEKGVRWVSYDRETGNEKIGLAFSLEREFSSPWIKEIGINLKVDQLGDNAGAITIMKGSEWAFRIRPSGKNGCLKSTSGGINSVTTKERYQAEKDSNG